jgi:hypothetical protein
MRLRLAPVSRTVAPKDATSVLLIMSDKMSGRQINIAVV